MFMLYRSKKIYVGDSDIHGRGVFCSEPIKAGEILEECHFFIAPENVDYPQIFRDHFFSWPKGEKGTLSICLGFGSIFNHSDFNWNADWETDTKMNKFIFFAVKDINPGEEIFTNYKK
jgi:SET domain-containing protein